MKTQPATLLTAALILAASWTGIAHGERPQTNNPNAFILSQTMIPFTQGGAAVAPSALLLALGQGKISPFAQFLLLNQLMTSCVKDVLKYVPHERDSYKKAKFLYDYAVCRVFSCVKQGLLFGVLSGDNGFGMKSNDANSGLAIGLANSLKGSDSCIEGSAAVDPALLQVATQGGVQK